MNNPRFVGIGKLGGRDCSGYYHVLIKPDRRELFSALDEVYLIFESDRVFFVSITNKKKSDKKLWIKFGEDGIDTERSKHREVILAIREDRIGTADIPHSHLSGYQVICGESVLGVVQDHFSNGAQEVLVIIEPSGCEILIPEVPHYIQAILHEQQTVILHNAEDLICFYQTEAKGKHED